MAPMPDVPYCSAVPVHVHRCKTAQIQIDAIVADVLAPWQWWTHTSPRRAELSLRCPRAHLHHAWTRHGKQLAQYRFDENHEQMKAVEGKGMEES